MTDRWLNWVLSVVVVAGMVAYMLYERPRLAEERAEFLDQEVAQGRDLPDGAPTERDPPQFRRVERDDVDVTARDADEEDEDDAEEDEEDGSQGDEEAAGPEPLGDHGVTAGHSAAVEIGMEVLDAGGNAVDAAIAVSYALGVVEPFGSGPGGGGAMLIHRPGEEPVAYDYRETAPLSGEVPASDIGVPGFVAGMEQIHGRHGTIELADLIEPAARLAEDGIEVDPYLDGRLRGAAHRLPIHLVPELFPGGAAIGAGETLRQPKYAEALRTIQDQGAEAVYSGELAQRIADAVSGIELEDLEAYEVLEVEPTHGRFAGYEVFGAGAPTSSHTVAAILQVAETLDVGELDLASADAYHVIAQSWRQALSDRTVYVGDPSTEDVSLAELLSEERTATLADRIEMDDFSRVEMEDDAASHRLETDTTHFVVVDDEGTMVSTTNTLSNFFGSGLPVSGFFMNDQLKNFSAEDDEVNLPAPGKRPRSFIAPMILARDELPVLGIGSPGGRRIPMMVAQVLIRWAAHGQSLADATAAPRFHLEGRALELEEGLPDEVRDDLLGRGYETVTSDVPTTEYFGATQALEVDWEAGQVRGHADDRRAGSWGAASR